MSSKVQKIHGLWSRLDSQVEALRGAAAGAEAEALEKWRAHSAALGFHLRERGRRPLLFGVFGGTGVGKSAMINRLAGAQVTASSFRRTFTKGPVAIVGSPDAIPDGWLAAPHRAAEDSPSSGAPGALLTVARPAGNAAPDRGADDFTKKITLIDTTDLDGDEPLHHEEADRVFRWVEAALFVVTPEKYQMTEPLAYFRMARRYRLPAIFLMNKLEERAVVDDFRRQLADRDWADARVFESPRDDAAYEPAEGLGLDGLRAAMLEIARNFPEPDRAGLALRLRDLLGRLRDQAIEPLRAGRDQADRLLAALDLMTAPEPGIDVGAATRALQRRLQEQSILYLMGPRRMWDRVKNAPTTLAGLPRALRGLLGPRGAGGAGAGASGGSGAAGGRAPLDAALAPDYRNLLSDQFRILQSRIDDLLRSDPRTEAWLAISAETHRAALIEPEEAARIADEELGELRAWLERRWNESPRDTALLKKALAKIPGGERLTAYSEAAPYLLAVVLAAHHAFFGPVDLIVLGGYNLATWLTERLSDEVAGRTRDTNRALARRFSELARRQVELMKQWVERQAPPRELIERVSRAADQIADEIGAGDEP